MKNGPARFELYLQKLEKLLADASGQPDPALSLYQNGARTPLFMLEGLARLYSGIHNKKRFTKIGMHFKLLEDALGAIDYYDGFAKQFSQDKKVPAAVTKAVQAKALEKTQLLNKLLKKKNWLGTDANRISRIRTQLRGADWLEDKAEMKAVESVYRRSITKIDAFAKTYDSGFTVLETQVHELRRKLRWLSIYPAALQGCIQLTTDASNDKNITKYLTPEIVNSPFNKMPDPAANRYLLMFDRDYFLALSWMIAELGKLKDQGLRTLVLNEVGKKAAGDAKYEAAILKQASTICRTYFTEKNLDRLISGIVRADQL
ncbi:MAG: hypothetical protein ABJB40_07570 [Acidobacteriota bacterium]